MKVAVFTGTRADYGLLYWLMRDIDAASDMELQLIVSGMHLSPEFGMTVNEIERDGFTVAAKVEMLLSSDSSVGTIKSMGVGLLGMADALERVQPDILIVLGDRTEALVVAQACLIMNIPLFHLHGGELTEGAYDDAIRHAISKMAYFHGVANDTYRHRVIQLGEAPERVFTVGALGLEHLNRTPLLDRGKLTQAIGFNLDKPFILMTYHPVTAADEPPESSCQAIIEALEQFPEYQVIVTYPNSDTGGRAIMPLLHAFAEDNPDRVLLVKSLGQLKYLSAVKHARMVLGNSSSGIIEVPSFNIPTVNIGLRQAGRIAAPSVIHCACRKEEITDAISMAGKLAQDIKEHPVVNPYGDGSASQKIVEILQNNKAQTTKKFFDIKQEGA